MTKHTPGPWEYDPTRCKDDNIFSGNLRIANIFGACDPSLDTAYEANARLIAAAPAMLEALQKLVDHVLHYATFEYSAEDAHKDAADARAAIALATDDTD